MNLKEKIYLYANSTTQKVSKRNKGKFFRLKIFSICTLSCEYIREFSKKFETALIGLG